MQKSLETEISRGILARSADFFGCLLDLDVAVVGGGPSGLVCARYAAEAGLKTAVFERHLSYGGGMWGGGMGHPFIVVEKEATSLLDAAGIKYSQFGDSTYTANSVESAAKLGVAAINSGVPILTGIVVEDVMRRKNKVCGIVVNGYGIARAGLHIDPLAISANFVVDATGHDCSVVKNLIGKNEDVKIRFVGERSMWADRGEKELLRNTGEVYPGLYVTGMAANAAYGSHRMGAIFGGMLISGKRCAELLIKNQRIAEIAKR